MNKFLSSSFRSFFTFFSISIGLSLLYILTPRLLRNKKITKIKLLKSDLEELNDIIETAKRIGNGNYKESNIDMPFELEFRKGLSGPVGLSFFLGAGALFFFGLAFLAIKTALIPALILFAFGFFCLLTVINVLRLTPAAMKLTPSAIFVTKRWSKTYSAVDLSKIDRIKLKLSPAARIADGKTLTSATFFMSDAKKISLSMAGFSIQSQERFIYFCNNKLKEKVEFTTGINW